MVQCLQQGKICFFFEDKNLIILFKVQITLSTHTCNGISHLDTTLASFAESIYRNN